MPRCARVAIPSNSSAHVMSWISRPLAVCTKSLAAAAGWAAPPPTAAAAAIAARAASACRLPCDASLLL